MLISGWKKRRVGGGLWDTGLDVDLGEWRWRADLAEAKGLTPRLRSGTRADTPILLTDQLTLLNCHVLQYRTTEKSSVSSAGADMAHTIPNDVVISV